MTRYVSIYLRIHTYPFSFKSISSAVPGYLAPSNHLFFAMPRYPLTMRHAHLPILNFTIDLTLPCLSRPVTAHIPVPLFAFETNTCTSTLDLDLNADSSQNNVNSLNGQCTYVSVHCDSRMIWFECSVDEDQCVDSNEFGKTRGYSDMPLYLMTGFMKFQNIFRFFHICKNYRLSIF